MIYPPYGNIALWIGIAFCIAQTGIFSGLNLADSASVGYDWRSRLLAGMATPPSCFVCAKTPILHWRQFFGVTSPPTCF